LRENQDALRLPPACALCTYSGERAGCGLAFTDGGWAPTAQSNGRRSAYCHCRLLCRLTEEGLLGATPPLPFPPSISQALSVAEVRKYPSYVSTKENPSERWSNPSIRIRVSAPCETRPLYPKKKEKRNRAIRLDCYPPRRGICALVNKFNRAFAFKQLVIFYHDRDATFQSLDFMRFHGAPELLDEGTAPVSKLAGTCFRHHNR
jgi:hypothetical protein